MAGPRGYPDADFAQPASFNQIRGFGEYGFPESHAASFALLVYVSAWLKCHEPAAFTCATAEQLSRWGSMRRHSWSRTPRRHGVEIRPVDVVYQPVGLAPWSPVPADLQPAAASRLQPGQGPDQTRGAEKPAGSAQ